MNIALVLSGGSGSRLGSDIPKQYLKVGDREILFYSLTSLVESKYIDGIQIIAQDEWREWILNRLDLYGLKSKFWGFSDPGETRQMSIYNGLVDIAGIVAPSDGVLIHDAARPNLSEKMITDCLEALKEHDGALPVLPMKDTVYLSTNGKEIASLLDRKSVVAGQAPESFLIGKYLKANERLFPKEILNVCGSTEPAFLYGMDIVLVPGDENNYKITTRADLEKFRQQLASHGVESELK